MRLKYSILPPLFFLMILWIIKITEIVLNSQFYIYGVFPRKLVGLPGIIFSPFIHSDFNHLISNSIPLFILATGLIYFYRDLAYRVILFVWVTSGIMVWVGARESYHIGASGIIYGIASFLFFSGIIRKDVRLMSISLLVVFLYGGLIWGIFPIFPQISWEYHLFGGISGFIAAIIYRKNGPPKQHWSWESEVDEEMDDESINFTESNSEMNFIKN